MVKHIANIITGFRILGSVLLLRFPPFSLAFMSIYLLCGFSDMIDGTIARKTNSTSQFGSGLDTIADLIFTVAAIVKLLPAIRIPGWLWIWGGVIAVIKLANIVLGFVRSKKFVAYHSVFNKTTGFALFILPLTFTFIKPTYTLLVICCLATIAAMQEAICVMKA